MRTIRTVDVHVSGQPVRVVIEGVPGAAGQDAREKAEWFAAHADDLRRALVHPPRGHDDLTAVALTEPSSAGAHAGLLFMDGGGYAPMSVSAVIAAATVAVDRGLLVTAAARGAEQVLTFDTPAGAVQACVRAAAPKVDGGAPCVSSVSLRLGPAFVHTPSAAVSRRSRRVPLDVVFAGGFFAIVDSESAGVPLDRSHAEDLRSAARELFDALDARLTLVHPARQDAEPVTGIVFTGPPSRDDAHLRGVAISRHGVVDRSSVSGTGAVLAVLDAMGLAVEGQPFAHEGTAGLTVSGVVTGRTTLGDVPAVHLEVTATALVIGESTWMLDERDPLRFGDDPGREVQF
jgi:proline racemase